MFCSWYASQHAVAGLDAHLHVQSFILPLTICYIKKQPASPLWFLLTYLISVTSSETRFSYQVCTSLRVSLLITDADKLLHSQERNLQSALQQKCKSCQVGSILLWRGCWFLHYLHTVNRVLSFCVMLDVCVVEWRSSPIYHISPQVARKWIPRPKYFSFIKRFVTDNQTWWKKTLLLISHLPLCQAEKKSLTFWEVNLFVFFDRYRSHVCT